VPERRNARIRRLSLPRLWLVPFQRASGQLRSLRKRVEVEGDPREARAHEKDGALITEGPYERALGKFHGLA